MHNLCSASDAENDERYASGLVTVLNRSFFRKDISKRETVFQIALALKDEVIDLEKAEIKIIQIDEAAFREGMPLKKGKQRDYLDWSVKSFKLTNEKVSAETQTHTHMCYSEFNEILGSIYAMNSDVISIESSRSKEEIHYDHGIGLGVYDIHSPRIPTEKEIILIVERSIKVINKELFWINPDCGLKTRNYKETIPALKNIVNVAKQLRGSNN
jgi:5-methyltetrahydropteroyltriglutamate--homocysteine methyltransferase